MDYPSNNGKSEPPKQTPEKDIQVIAEGAVTRKPGLSRRFKNVFIGNDSRTVWDVVLRDTIFPQVRMIAADAFAQFGDRVILGQNRAGRGTPGYVYRPGGTASGAVAAAYNSAFKSSTGPIGSPTTKAAAVQHQMSQQARAAHNFDEILLPSRQQADEILDAMYNLLEKYELVTVNELYKMCGIATDYTQEKWGWTSLAGSGVTRVDGLFLLNLPRPIVLPR